MMLTYGFEVWDSDGMLSFWPRRAPEENAILRFPYRRGQMLEIEIGLTGWSTRCLKVNAL